MAVELSVQAEISEAIHRFYYLVDDGVADKTSVFFTPDAEWVFGPGAPNPGTLRGEEIERAMEVRSASTEILTRHLVTNLIFSSSGSEGVEARYMLLLFRAKESDQRAVSRVVADVNEQWCQIHGDWKIKRRTVFPSFY